MTQLVFIATILGLLYSLVISEKCDKSLGLESGNVRPYDMHASSQLDKWHGPDRGRLNLRPDLDGGGSWTAKTNDQSQWIQVNMRRVRNVSGIITQGRSGHYSQWVTSFIVLYSMDAQTWQNVTDTVGDTMTFTGNDDQDTEVTNMFSSPVMMLYIRLKPTSWHEHISLRFEVLICKETDNKNAINESCTTNALGMESRRIPSINIQASSELRDNFGARRARLNSVSDSDGHGGWIPAQSNMNQWIQVDLSASKYVTGVITQGYETGWVTRFEILYADDRNANEWQTVRLSTGSPLVFEGNMDGVTAVTNILPEFLITRFLRIHPVDWHDCIVLRFDILGCPGRLNRQTNCSDVFEMTSDKVSLTASSNYIVGRYWFPDYDREHPWIQANFEMIKKVTGVTTRGSVTSFTVLYSIDGNNIETVIGEGNHVMEFPGSPDDVEKVNIFINPVITHFIRIQPTSWKNRVTLRFQIIVCPGNVSIDERYRQPLGMESRDIPSSDIESSSEWNDFLGPRRARLNNIRDSDGAGAWSSRYKTQSQWIQVNFRKLRNISGLITQGRSKINQWVESYQVLHSTNGGNWTVILDSSGMPKEFVGNNDSDTQVTSLFPTVLLTQYIRVRPISWFGHISMRFEIIGYSDYERRSSDECRDRLGMESGDIPSDAIVTSSEWSSRHSGHRARLNIVPDSDGIGAWSTKTNNLGQWIQVDLGNITTVSGLITQGRMAYSQFVTVYKVEYSLDGIQWQYVSQNGYEKEFKGNSDTNTPVTRLFPVPVFAKYIRIHPIAWKTHISMRLEILGCSANRSTAVVVENQTNECKDRLGMESRNIPSEAIVTSSDWDSNHAGRRARLNIVPDSDGIGAWCAKANNLGQWIQVDLGNITTVSGLITQGRIAYSQFVTVYKVEYSLDGIQWQYVSQNDYEKEFIGNFDADTAVTRLFPVPVFAKYIRIHPVAWVRHISMRFEILGCSVNRSIADVGSQTSNCTDGLGLESGYIPSSFIESSGESILGRGPEHARLNLITSDSDDWCVSDTRRGIWIQVNFGSLHNVTGVIIQKPLNYQSYVTSFQVMHSLDKLAWETIPNAYGNPKVFPGTISETTRFIRFPSTFTAKYIRIQPTSWVNDICMRFEITGCISGRRTLKGCRESLGMISGEIPRSAIQVSSELDNQGSHLARLNSTIGGKGVSAWCPVNQNRYQWIQVYLGKLHIVSGIMTQGQWLQWVTLYEVSYRVNGNGWTVVLGQDGLPREFIGNYDEDTGVTNVLPEPIRAQFIRIRPLSWHTYPCLRFEVLGCLDVDDCVAGVCQNGGSCIDGLGTYTCECLFGFDGDNCDQETGVHT